MIIAINMSSSTHLNYQRCLKDLAFTKAIFCVYDLSGSDLGHSGYD